MRALKLAQLRELERLLAATPGLVDAYERREPGFAADVVEWLREVEAALEHNKMHVVSAVAQCRAAVVGAQRGHPPPGIEIQGRPTRRKLVDGAALRALRETSGTLHDAISDRVGQFEEASKVAQQMVSIALLKHLAEPHLAVAHPQRRLEGLRAAMRDDADLIPYDAALGGLVCHEDALVLIDQAVGEVVA